MIECSYRMGCTFRRKLKEVNDEHGTLLYVVDVAVILFIIPRCFPCKNALKYDHKCKG